MRAIVLTEYGDVDKLELREVPEPKVKSGELRVRAAASSINPIDWKLRSGAAKAMMPLQLPAILGRDVSGEVIEVGAGVRGFAVGDKVLGLVKEAYAEQVVAAAEAFAKIPSGLDVRDAAALPLVLITGAQLMEGAVQIKRGQTVLVTGALGGVGRTAVYVARQHGARVLAGVRGKQREEAKALGADQVVAIDDEAELSRLPELDAIADTVGHDVIGKLLPRLRKGGTLGSVLGEPPAAKGRDLIVRAFMAQPDSKRLSELAEAVARGKLTIPIARRLPLAEAREAQRAAERGGIGKVLLTM